jgi:hypothetical protein
MPRYQLRNCVEVCRSAIHALDSARVSWPTTLALLHLPPGLQEVDAFSSLAEVRQRGLGARLLGHLMGGRAGGAGGEPPRAQ